MEDIKERYEIIEEAATDAIATLNEDGIILSISRAAERMFGFTSSEMVGQPIHKIVPEFRSHLKEARSSGAGMTVVEVRGRQKGGKDIQLELSVGEHRRNDRYYFTCIIRDIAQRKDTDRRLAAQYAVTRALAESSSLGEATPKL